MHQPDFLDRHARVRERIRRIETGVHQLPAGTGQFGRRSGWMKMTPVPPCEYVDDDEPAVRAIFADLVYVICPGLVVPAGDVARIFTLGPSARPSFAQYLPCEGAATIEVRPSGNIYALDVADDVSFDIAYTLG